MSKKRRTKSLRRRLLVLINLTVFSVIAVCVILNSLTFQSYYMYKKTDTILGHLAYIEKLLNNKELDADELQLEMEQLCVNSNVSVMVFDSEGHTVYTSVPQNAFRFQRAPEFSVTIGDGVVEFKQNPSYGRPYEDNGGREVIKEGDNYVFSSSYVEQLNARILELNAVVDGDYRVIIQSSVAPIKESVLFSNRFLIIIGIIVWAIAAIIIMFISRKLTKPLNRLSEIAKRMAELDFSQKYEGKTYDEVGMLGESINTMSDKLQKAISGLKSANVQLMRDIDKKEKIDKQRKDFISNVSHELKTPISIIEAYAEGLTEMELDDDSKAYYCEVIMDEAQRMNALIKKLMALMRIESGSDKLDITNFDIVEQISEILRQKSILIEQSGITVEFDCKEPVYVWADDFLIEEVFLNYLTNAIKYSSGEKRVRITIERIEDNVRVSMFNTGEPIDEETLENMWKSFYMADKARVRYNGSSGLGLSIVAAIISAHNHKYGAYNTDGGVVFWFELDGKSE